MAYADSHARDGSAQDRDSRRVAHAARRSEGIVYITNGVVKGERLRIGAGVEIATLRRVLEALRG